MTLDGVSSLLVDAGHDLEPSILVGFDDDVGPLLQQALPVQRGRFYRGSGGQEGAALLAIISF